MMRICKARSYRLLICSRTQQKKFLGGRKPIGGVKRLTANVGGIDKVGLLRDDMMMISRWLCKFTSDI